MQRRLPDRTRDPVRLNAPHPIDRRAFLGGAGRVAGALAAGAFGGMAPGDARAQRAAEIHAMSARVVDRLKTQFTFQISVDVGSLAQGLEVARAALAGGIDIVEMGTPLLKNEGVANVVPAFRRAFPDALLLADMKTMDGGAFEARAVYAAGGDIVDFLALAGVHTARSICAVRDEFRRSDPGRPRLAFADILLPQQGPADTAVEVAARMLEAGVDGVGVHLQADARRADPTLIDRGYLGEVATTVFKRVGAGAPVQVVGGLSTAQARSLAQAGLRGFVISGNLGQPDARARYDLPPDQIRRLVADFVGVISKA